VGLFDLFKGKETASKSEQVASKKSGSDAFMSEFQSVVLAHLNSEIDDDAWAYFREIARTGMVEVPIEGSDHWTREQLVEGGVTIGGGSIQDTLDAFKEKLIVKIGAIQDRPVHFIVEEGVYLWALADDAEDALELWITCPAYPPGW
jgi:hypothetical protein